MTPLKTSPPHPPPLEEATVLALHQGLRDLLALFEQAFYQPLTRAHLGGDQGDQDPRETRLDREEEPPF